MSSWSVPASRRPLPTSTAPSSPAESCSPALSDTCKACSDATATAPTTASTETAAYRWQSAKADAMCKTCPEGRSADCLGSSSFDSAASSGTRSARHGYIQLNRYLTRFLHGRHIVWTLCELVSESTSCTPL